MKVGLLADIHGNADALAAVLAAARAADVEHLLVAGDIVGYYDRPAAVIDQLDGWSWQGVRGNHEDLLGDRLRDGRWEDERRRHGSGLLAASRLPDATRQRLLTLPHPLAIELDGARVLLCHGAPWDVDLYVYPDAAPELRDRVLEAAAGFDLVVLGHTHHPMWWQAGAVRVVNPGSVGQPRDRKPGACWALWDTATGTVDLLRQTYDSAPVRDRAREVDPDVPYLWEVLTRS